MVNRHSFIPIRQMAVPVRRALVEVCTVPVLLVVIVLCFIYVIFECHIAFCGILTTFVGQYCQLT